jgi:hypothetical protein
MKRKVNSRGPRKIIMKQEVVLKEYPMYYKMGMLKWYPLLLTHGVLC